MKEENMNNISALSDMTETSLTGITSTSPMMNHLVKADLTASLSTTYRNPFLSTHSDTPRPHQSAPCQNSEGSSSKRDATMPRMDSSPLLPKLTQYRSHSFRRHLSWTRIMPQRRIYEVECWLQRGRIYWNSQVEDVEEVDETHWSFFCT